jgi:hypothetical protein
LRATEESRRHQLLDETTLVAIDECGERLSRLCTELLRGTDTRSEIRSTVGTLTALLERLDALDVSR